MAGSNRLVCVRVDAERDADEHPLDARGPRTVELIGCVEDDERVAGRSELLVGLVVPVHDEPVRRDAGLAGEGELPKRRHVGADAFLGQEAEDADVRERLRPVDDERLGSCLAIRACLRANRLLAVDDERSAVLLGEVGRPEAAEHQLAGLVDRSGVREELEHDASDSAQVRKGSVEKKSHFRHELDDARSALPD